VIDDAVDADFGSTIDGLDPLNFFAYIEQRRKFKGMKENKTIESR
jgi:hypothetical protein